METIRVGVCDLPPVIADGVRGWLRRDWRTVPVLRCADADVLVRDPLAAGALRPYQKPVVAFCPDQPAARVAALLRGGVRAFVPQSGHREALLAAIVTVASGRTARPEAPDPFDRRPVPRLSERERTALVWWLRSMTKASVARRMGVSPHTVDMYIKRVRAKYAGVGFLVPTKADLLARAVEDGLVGPEDLPDQRVRWATA